MTLTLLPIPSKPRTRCDTRALKQAREAVRRDLESDAIERRISAQLVDKHNRHVQESRKFHLTGETA